MIAFRSKPLLSAKARESLVDQAVGHAGVFRQLRGPTTVARLQTSRLLAEKYPGSDSRFDPAGIAHGVMDTPASNGGQAQVLELRPHSKSMRPQSSGRPCTPERGAQAMRDLLMFSPSAASRLSPS